MAGNRIGGLKAQATMIERLGLEAYTQMVKDRGRKGGKNSSNKAWLQTQEGKAHIARAGAQGGSARRTS